MLLGLRPRRRRSSSPLTTCENYVSASPKGPGDRYATRAKSEKEIEALIRVIQDINPDILGVCEMGSPERFEDFKKRLNEAGLGYVASEYLAGRR